MALKPYAEPTLRVFLKCETEVRFLAWWVWALIGIAAALLIMDWIIVMGADPRKWKGGMKEYEHSGIRGKPDQRTKR